MTEEWIEIQHPDGGGGTCRIPASQFNPKVHKRAGGAPAPRATATAAVNAPTEEAPRRSARLTEEESKSVEVSMDPPPRIHGGAGDRE